MATIPSTPTLPSIPDEPGFWDTLQNDGAKAADKAQDYYKKASDDYDRAKKLYDEGSNAADRAKDLYGKGDDALDKAKDLLDNDSLPGNVPGLNDKRDELRGRADEAAAAKRRELDELLANLEDSPDAEELAAAKRRELDELLAGLEDGPGYGGDLPLVGTDTDGFFDAPPGEAPEEEELEARAIAETDEEAAAVVCVCRNLLNTLDTRPAGYYWLSA